MLVDTQDVAYPYNGILFSLKKKGNSDICYNMMNLWIFHLTIRLSEISTKQSISTYARYLEESNPQRQKVEWWLPGAGVRVRGGTIAQWIAWSFDLGRCKSCVCVGRGGGSTII